MIVICKATRVVITYFNQSAKENENLSLIQDFVTWLALQYNLEVKIIQSVNKINYIKTKKWCNNVGISFKLSAPDTHLQIDGAKRFGQLIIKKASIIRLSANLPYKL